MLAAGVVAIAVLHAYRLAVPPRPNLASAVRRWDASRARATRIQRIGAPKATTASGKAQNWMVDQVLRRARDVKHLTQDLAVTGSTIEQHVGKAILLVMVGFVGPVVVLGCFNTIGIGLPLVLGPALGAALAAAMLFVTRQELADKAKKKRTEFRRTLS